MWNAKIQWNKSVCQSPSWIQLRSLGFGPTTHLCVRQSMPDNGFCLTIPAHLSTLPPCSGCKEHPINYRDHTDLLNFPFHCLLSLVLIYILKFTLHSSRLCLQSSTDFLIFIYDCDTNFVNLMKDTFTFWKILCCNTVPSSSVFKYISKGGTVRLNVKVDVNHVDTDGNNFQCGSSIFN